MSLSLWKRVLSAPYGLPLGVSILLHGVLIAVVVPILPLVIADKVGLDKAEVTIFFLINTLLGIVVTLITGYLSDGAIARHKLVLVGGIIAAVGYFGIASATQASHAYLAGAVGAGAGILFPQLFAVAKAGVVADWERDAQVMGITALRTLFSFGFIIGTGISSWLAQAIDIQAAFYFVGATLLVLTLYSARVLFQLEKYIAQHERELKSAAEANPQAPAQRQIVLPVAALIMPLLALIVLRGADGTRGVYLSLVMFQIFQDASVAPLLFGITAAAELVTMGLAGYVSSKIGEKTTIALGALTGAVYFVILSFTQSLTVLYLAHVLYAVFVAVLLGVAMAYVQNLLSHRAGMGGSLYVAVFNFGSLIGLLTPLLTSGYDQKVFVIPAILCVVGAAMLMVGDRTAEIEKRLRAANMVASGEVKPQETGIPGIPPIAVE